MRYFENFPVTQYTFDPDRREFFAVKDIFTRVNMLDSVITNSLVYYDYIMKESDNLEIIAHKYYGDVNKYWIIAFTNRILNPLFEIPLKQQQFEEYLTVKYGSIANSLSILDHYEKTMINSMTSSNGAITTSTTITYYPNTTYSIDGHHPLPGIGDIPLDISPAEQAYFALETVETTITISAVNAYDTELNANEAKRRIKLIKKDFAPQIEAELKKLLKQTTGF